MKNLVTHIGGVPVDELAKRFATPAFIYERAVIEKRIGELKAFDVVRFAQKACSNLALLALMKRNGVVVDAVSAGEVYRALKVGFSGQGHPPGIVFTADMFDQDAADMIREHKIPVNVGSPDMITATSPCASIPASATAIRAR
jgi:diaminopimelate decarboxylase